MPTTYSVTVERTSDMEQVGENDKVTMTFNQEYAVMADTDSPSLLNLYDVMNAPGLPTVNSTTYVVGEQVMPYMVCRKKKIRRDPRNLKRFIVSTSWRGGIQVEAVPVSLSDLTPWVESELSDYEQVMYVDKAGNRVLTPLGNFYAEPVVEKVPLLKLKITQFESFLSYNDMVERKNTCNSGTYRNQPKYSWLIQDIEVSEVKVKLVTGMTSAAMATYHVVYNPNQWYDQRALIDTEYIDANGKTVPFGDGELKTINYGLIDHTGAKSPVLEYDKFEPYESKNYGLFLQA